MSDQQGTPSTPELDRTETEVQEWAVQCHTLDGGLHTGRLFTTELEAIESGKRLERINGAQWWLVSRWRFVTVNTTPWAKVET